MSAPTQESAWAAPLILVSVALAAGLLGYYQLFYLPTLAPRVQAVPPFNVTVSIVFGAQLQSQAQNFVPKNVTVVLGNNSMVIWVNQDTVPHTATSDPGAPEAFDTGLFQPGASASIIFTKPGVYKYHCTPHAPWMKDAYVIVKEAPVAKFPGGAGFIPPNLASLLQGVLRALSALAGLPGA